MITEDYVSFEIAKLLREKGFDTNTPVNYFVGDDKHRRCIIGEMIYHKKAKEDTHLIACPTHQMARTWLRKEHYIYADPIKQGNYNDCSEYYSWIVACMGIIHRNPSVADKLSYEDAVEAALKYSLENLI